MILHLNEAAIMPVPDAVYFWACSLPVPATIAGLRKQAITRFDPCERIRSIRSGARCTSSPLAVLPRRYQGRRTADRPDGPWDAPGHASCAGDSQGSFAVAGLLAEVPSEPLLRACARTQCVSLGVRPR